MVLTSQQHVVPFVKGVEWELSTRGVRMLAAFWAGISVEVNRRPVFFCILCLFNHTENVIDNTLVEFGKFNLFAFIHYGQKISRNYSKLGPNCKILINPAKVIFVYGNPYLYFQFKCLFN